MEISNWPVIPGYVCRQCGDAARENPENVREWGCAKCNGSSHSVFLCFQNVDGTIIQDWQLEAAVNALVNGPEKLTVEFSKTRT